RGLADNYWHMGVPGPGGPCSEIYYDRGPEYGRDGGPEADEDRFLEVWNLVFMQDQLSKVRAKDDFDIEGLLPSRNVDTGMGLERMASILQGVDNLYEIDTTWKILDRAAELTEQSYGRDHRADVALRVIADHVRSAVMLIGDGVLPGNEGRGYVLRRIVRRSIRNLRVLAGGHRGGAGATPAAGERFMHELTSVALEAMGDLYPELRSVAANISTVIDAEEVAFASTLRTGTAIFDASVEENRRKNSTTLSGAQAFQLHDTYGFPIDLVLDRTPFYAEGGGQLADAGTIRVTGGEFAVRDVQTPLPRLIVHRGQVSSGEITVGAPAFAEIDVERRRALSRSHTATHLVHRALRSALGESAAQAGSENSPGRLRFDFTAQ